MHLRQYLDMHGITTVAFAKQCGLSQGFVWRIAHGKRGMSPKVAKRIEQETSGAVSIMELLYPKDEFTTT